MFNYALFVSSLQIQGPSASTPSRMIEKQQIQARLYDKRESQRLEIRRHNKQTLMKNIRKRFTSDQEQIGSTRPQSFSLNLFELHTRLRQGIPKEHIAPFLQILSEQLAEDFLPGDRGYLLSFLELTLFVDTTPETTMLRLKILISIAYQWQFWEIGHLQTLLLFLKQCLVNILLVQACANVLMNLCASPQEQVIGYVWASGILTDIEKVLEDFPIGCKARIVIVEWFVNLALENGKTIYFGNFNQQSCKINMLDHLEVIRLVIEENYSHGLLRKVNCCLSVLLEKDEKKFLASVEASQILANIINLYIKIINRHQKDLKQNEKYDEEEEEQERIANQQYQDTDQQEPSGSLISVLVLLRRVVQKGCGDLKKYLLQERLGELVILVLTTPTSLSQKVEAMAMVSFLFLGNEPKYQPEICKRINIFYLLSNVCKNFYENPDQKFRIRSLEMVQTIFKSDMVLKRIQLEDGCDTLVDAFTDMLKGYESSTATLELNFNVMQTCYHLIEIVEGVWERKVSETFKESVRQLLQGVESSKNSQSVRSMMDTLYNILQEF